MKHVQLWMSDTGESHPLILSSVHSSHNHIKLLFLMPIQMRLQAGECLIKIVYIHYLPLLSLLHIFSFSLSLVMLHKKDFVLTSEQHLRPNFFFTGYQQLMLQCLV